MVAITAVTSHDPHACYMRLLARPPHFDDSLGLWLAARAEDVEAVLRHPACRVRPLAEPVPTALREGAAGSLFGHLLRMNDGVSHAALKALIGDALLGADSELHQQARQAAQRLGASWGREPPGDALDHYLRAMPVYSLTGLFGVPQAQQPALLQRVTALVGGLSPLADGAARAVAHQATDALRRDFAELLRPGTLAGRLALAARQADIAAEVLLDNAIGLLWQSFDACAGLIGNSLVRLARHSPLREGLRAGSVELAGLVAEVARFDAPVQNTRRYLAEDVLIGRQRLPAGACVLVLLAAANLDPVANPQPERFDPARPAPRCWTFGSGPHACPGARLAQTIAAAALERCLQLWPDEYWSSLATPRYRPSLNARIPHFAAGVPR